LHFLERLTDQLRRAYLVYGGEKQYVRQGVNVLSWRNLSKMSDD
jgi:hypothetical protein